MAKAKASIDVGINERSAVESLKKLSRSWGEFATGLNQSLELVSKGYGLVAGTVGKAVDVLGQYIDAANTQVEAEQKLRLALEQTGNGTEANFQKWTQFASGLQSTTRIGDEATLSLQAQLLTLGVTEDRLGDATKATIGFSKAMGTGLNESAKIVSKALGGNVGALKEYGIEAANANEATERLTALFAIAETEAQNYQGRMIQLSNAWGDFEEGLGKGVVTSEAANAILVFLRQTVEQLSAFIGGPAGARLINGFFQGIADGARSTLLFVQLLDEALRDLRLSLGAIVDDGGFFSATRFAERQRQLSALVGQLGQISSGQTNVTANDTNPTGARLGGGRGAQGSGGGGADLDAALSAAGILDQATYMDAARDEIDRMQTQAERREEIQRESAETTKRYWDDLHNYYSDLNTKQEQDEKRAARQREDARRKEQQRLREQAAEVNEMVGAQASAVTGAVAQMGGALAAGFRDLLTAQESNAKSMGEQFGDIVIALGETLVQMGFAASAMGVLGTLVPALAGVTGGPAGIAAGAVTAAAGFAMIGVGAAMGGGRPAQVGGSAPTGVGGARGRAPSAANDQPQFTSAPQLGGQAIALTVNFNRPVANERRTARELSDMLQSRLDLRPAGVGG